MMVKGKLKEIREKEESSDFSSIQSQLEDLENKISNSEEKREENKKVMLSLIDKVENLSSQGESNSISPETEEN